MDENEIELEKVKLEREKFLLDVEKFRFEERKFDAEAEARAETLAKIRTEKLKASLESKELDTSFWKRPVFVTAIFQGLAVVIALGSIFYTTSLNEKISEATHAKAERDAANREEAQAQRDSDSAKRDRDSAKNELRATESSLGSVLKELDSKNQELKDARSRLEQQLNSAKADLREVDLRRDEARQEAILAPAREILLAIEKEAKETPKVVWTINNRPVADVGDALRQFYFFQLEKDRLVESISSADASANAIRLKYVKQFAISETEPAMARIAVLEALYEWAQKSAPADDGALVDFREQLIAIATSTKDGTADTENWRALRGFLHSDDLAALYICRQYDSIVAGDSNFSKERFEMERYIYQEFPSQEKCANAWWNYLDPAAWDDPSANKYHEGYPQELILSRFFESGHPQILNGNISIEVPPKGERQSWRGLNQETSPDRKAEIRSDLDWQALSFRNDKLQKLQAWWNNNKQLTSILNERGLGKLRTCNLEIVRRFRAELYVGLPELQKYCPASVFQIAAQED